MGAEAGRLVRDKTSLGKKAAHDRSEKKKKRVIELGEMDLTSDNLDLAHPKSPKVKSSQGEKVPRKEKKTVVGGRDASIHCKASMSHTGEGNR